LVEIAIPALFGQPSYPTIPVKPLQSEQPLRNIEKSGWRYYPSPGRLCDMGFALTIYAIAQAVEPATSDRGKRKTHPPMKEMGLR